MKAVGNTWLLWILNFIPQIGIALLLSVWFTSVRLRIQSRRYLANHLLFAEPAHAGSDRRLVF